MARSIVDIERGLIGTVLNNPEERLAEAERWKVSPGWFSDDSCSLLWSAILEARRRGEALQPLSLVEAAVRIGNADGERRDPSGLDFVFVEKCIDRGGYAASVEPLLQLLHNAYLERQTKKRFAEVVADFDKWADARTPLRDLRGKLDELIEKADEADPKGSAADMSFYDLPEAPPEAENPRALLANGFLRKGHGLMVVSVSGAGKSVFATQMILCFAIGRDFFGMKPLRRMKIGLIQAEDDEEEMSFFRSNMRRAFTQESGWTSSDFDDALRSVTITRRFLGKTGEDFLDELKCWQAENRFDLIVVNPLFSYFGGDLASGRDVAEFFRERLDPMLKDPENGFAIVFIHHTIKPPKSAEDRKLWNDSTMAQYACAGSTDLAGWSRASFLILPVTGHYGWSRLIVSKREGRLGWRDESGAITKERLICHGRAGGVYWRDPDAAEIPEDVRKAVAVDAKPCEIGEDEARQRMLAHLRVQPMKTTPFFEWCKGQFKGLTSRGEVPAKRAYYSVVNDPARWGLEKVKVKGGAYLLRAQGALTGEDGAPISGEVTPAAGSDAANVAGPRVGDYDGEDGDSTIDDLL